MKIRIVLFLLFNCFILKPFAQAEGISKAGDVIVIALPVASITMSLIKKDKKGTWQFTKGLLVNQAITFGLKSIISKPRPDGSNEQSFPSGHSSTTFQSASFIQRRYGWKYGVPSYLLASFTAYSRVEAEKHDGWDVFAGALIGIGSTYIFTTPYQKEHMEVTFNNVEGDRLIGFKYSF